ncbi:MAG: sigma 54-interacting transcriptional regulator [Myxococcales bacterium]
MNLAEVASELASMSEEEAAAETTTELGNDGAGDPCEVGPLLFRLMCADDLSQPAARYPLFRIGEASFARSRVPAAEIQGNSLRLGLKDRFASPSHARLEQDADGSWHVRDEGSTNGTLVNSEPVRPGDSVRLRDGDLLEMGHTFFLFRASAVGAVPASRGPDSFEGEPLTLNPEWELELSRADRLARTSHEVLIQGESGAGKEVLARFLHSRSRRKGPLVSVNCGALSENLLEDELFGHVRGAFSGAHADRQGLIRAAHQGTLFLDELGDMAPGLQVKLLRVLEDHKVRPVGSEREFPVDLRVIAATNRSLEEMVAQGRFRADLFARVGLLPVRVPALRQRREDLGLLIRAILRDVPLERVSFRPDALRFVLQHSWPLNVRELRQALLVAVDLAASDGEGPMMIAPHHLPQSVRERRMPALASTAAPSVRPQAKRDLTKTERERRDRIRDLLLQSNGNIAAAARAMGKARTQIQRWIARYGIDVAAIRATAQ